MTRSPLYRVEGVRKRHSDAFTLHVECLDIAGGEVLCLVGPTGAGKSELALRMAEELDGEIVNCDSTAVYRGFDIGTDKLPEAERRGIPVIAPVHYALMAEGDPADIIDISRALDRCMGDASAIVLEGYHIPTEEGQAMGPRLREPDKRLSGAETGPGCS